MRLKTLFSSIVVSATLLSIPLHSHAWVSNVTDSTGNKNIGSATLNWVTGPWSSCDASSRSCGSSTGKQTRSVFCNAGNLNGSNATVSDNYCQSVSSSIGARPNDQKSCSRYWGACPPPPPPPSPPSPPSSSSSSGGGCSYSATVCGLYSNNLGRAPDAGGAAYWQSQINSGVSPAQLQQNFMAGVKGARDCNYTGNKAIQC
ncbi:DUF4214 domain-containing protein [Neptuniibacter sp. QD37_11]|uniref:DUF4214 domain-containing protein n=1 Tax=Neptuniibacter sp. QD37_11 TaxID=3398209 RepID=UPI0039F49EBA